MLPRDTGYLYGAGWAQVANSLWALPIDAGFQYSNTYNDYTTYMSGPKGILTGCTYAAGQTVTLDVRTVPLQTFSYVQIFVNGTKAFSCGSPDPSMAVNYGSNGLGWAGNCCVWKKMVSIAQENSCTQWGCNNFASGETFGPFTWGPCVTGCYDNGGGSGQVELGQYTGTPYFSWFPWTAGGYQSWPNDSSSPNPRVIVQFVSPNVETDTINLHP